MDNTENKKKLRRFIDNLYSKNEVPSFSKLFKDIKEESLLEVSDEIWDNSAFETNTTSVEKERYKKEARKIINECRPKNQSILNKFLYPIISTAAILFIAFISYNYFGSTNSNTNTNTNIAYTIVSTSYGEKKQVILSDGSAILLNACSSLKYPDKFNNERKIILNGQASFKVTRNESLPFIVKCNKFDVRVLGTEFDIKSYSKDEIVSVDVKSGKVQVDLSNAMFKLVKQEQVFINTTTGDFTKRKNENEMEFSGWKNGVLRFSSTPIKDVIHELERVYNCHISFAPGYEFTNLISGEHDNKNLESVLQSLEFTSGIKYRKDGSNIVLFK